MGTFAVALALEEVAAADMGMAVSLSVHLLSQLCIVSAGTDEQKERLLPPMTAGRELGAFALTEPGAGSDAASLALAARRDGDAYLLSGTKIWITNAGDAARYIVFATVDRSRGKNGITAFVVESDTPGFRLGSKERKMGIRGTTGGGARVRGRPGAGGEPARRGGRRAADRALRRSARAASASPRRAPASRAAPSSWPPATRSSAGSSAGPSPTRR